MEASIKFRFTVGLLVTILAVVSTALVIHLHLKSKVKSISSVNFMLYMVMSSRMKFSE